MDYNKKELAKYWMKKSKRSLEAAQHEFECENHDFCANRLYYSAFYAVSAVLILKGQTYKKHSAVRAALHRDFVKEGLIPIEYGALYDALLQDREEADYVAFVEFDPEILEEEIKQVEEFIKEFEKLFTSLIKSE
jgi:hypothetical protein